MAKSGIPGVIDFKFGGCDWMCSGERRRIATWSGAVVPQSDANGSGILKLPFLHGFRWKSVSRCILRCGMIICSHFNVCSATSHAAAPQIGAYGACGAPSISQQFLKLEASKLVCILWRMSLIHKLKKMTSIVKPEVAPSAIFVF